MTEQLILAQYLASSQNAKARAEAVNALRHLSMDVIAFDTKDDAKYMLVYKQIMERIATSYLLLSWEVKRQMAKKSRRQIRRSGEKQQASVHI